MNSPLKNFNNNNKMPIFFFFSQKKKKKRNTVYCLFAKKPFFLMSWSEVFSYLWVKVLKLLPRGSDEWGIAIFWVQGC